MEKIPFFLFSILLLSSCHNSNVTTEYINPNIKVDETEVHEKSLIPDFISVCSSDGVKPINIKNDLTVWGFDPLLADKERKCEKLNLNDYSEMDCEYSEDLIQNSGIHLYKDSEGWYKFIYQNSDICTDALETYAAQSEEL